MSGDMNRSLIQGLRKQILNINHPEPLFHRSGTVVVPWPFAVFDLLDHTAHQVVDLFQRRGGAERAEELDALAGRQQLDGQD